MEKLSLLVALGANLPSTVGSASETLRAALNTLHVAQNISITAISRFWLTPSDPPGSGPDYVNAAAAFATSLQPDAVLQLLHEVESIFGRDRSTGRWSARVLDLDLLAVNDLVLPDSTTLQRWITLPRDRQLVETPDRLILPHPRIQDRGFVLAPLAEIAPLWRHPLTGRTVVEMLEALGPDALDGMNPLARFGGAGEP